MSMTRVLPVLLLLLAPLGLAQAEVAPMDFIDEVLDKEPEAILPAPLGSEEPDEAPAEPPAQEDDSLGGKFRDAFSSTSLAMGLAGIGATAFGVLGFGMVTRYISPKEALKNPQRAMLYGFIRATPGAHLKQLSDEFQMKTSSILWHIRKLESADLVSSERANGFRVFYPVDGGVEAKMLSRAISALQNENARRVQEVVGGNPGLSVKQLAERTSILGGTVRWHLRKLRDFGLLDELVREDGSLFYGTPLGERALETTIGRPVTKIPPKGTPADA
jgi:DNA-binding transcriptional ArsR family regulator